MSPENAMRAGLRETTTRATFRPATRNGTFGRSSISLLTLSKDARAVLRVLDTRVLVVASGLALGFGLATGARRARIGSGRVVAIMSVIGVMPPMGSLGKPKPMAIAPKSLPLI